MAQPSAQVECIRLGQDSLNTHTPEAFDAVLPPSEAFELSHRVAPHETPLTGAWRKMAEIACAALAAQGLSRRLSKDDTWRREGLAWAAKRHQPRNTVAWKFSQHEARINFQRHSTTVQTLN